MMINFSWGRGCKSLQPHGSRPVITVTKKFTGFEG